MKEEVFFIRYAKTARLKDTMSGEKKLRDGSMPVEEMISITFNR